MIFGSVGRGARGDQERPWRGQNPIDRVFRGATPTGQARGKRVGPAFARRKTARGNTPIHRGGRPAIGALRIHGQPGRSRGKTGPRGLRPRPFVRGRSPPERFGRSSRRRGPGRAWAVSAVVGVSHGGRERSGRPGEEILRPPAQGDEIGPRDDLTPGTRRPTATARRVEVFERLVGGETHLRGNIRPLGHRRAHHGAA